MDSHPDDASPAPNYEAADFRTFFEQMPARCLAVAVDAPHFTVLGVTDAYCRDFGVSRQAVLGRGFFEVPVDALKDEPDPRSGHSAAALRASFDAVLRSGAPHTPSLQLERPGARTWRVRNTPVVGDDGAVRYILHQLEASPEGSEERYRLLFESIDEGFCVIEVIFDADDLPVDYRFVETNQAFVEQTGLADAVGRTARELVPNLEPYWFETYGRIARTGQSLRFESGSDALARWFDVYAFRIGPPEDRHVALLFKDISEGRAANAERERLLRQSEVARQDAESARAEAEEANRAKAEFLAVMSHELRTPLNAIGGYAELLEMGIRGPVSAQQQEDLRRIQNSQRHLLGLINEVLNYAKLETGMVHFDLQSVAVEQAVLAAESLVAPQARAKGLSLVVAACGPGLAVRADAEKLRQILVNLLSNALKFTELGGRIEVRCAAKTDWVTIEVSDTGLGIPPERSRAIFEPFVQVRSDLTRPHDGTGLGLAISRDLARGMGGELVLSESTPGVGSTFALTLPVG